MSGVLFIRAAVAGDQPVIVRMVREAGINPMALHWQHFLVAQDGSEIVGIGQIKPHGDGSRELASIAVSPHRQGQGIATALVLELLRREPGVTYLYCREQLVTFYARFGYYPIAGTALPPVLRRMYRIPQVYTFLVRALRGEPIAIAAMRRDGAPPPKAIL